jgi:cytidylate kinase
MSQTNLESRIVAIDGPAGSGKSTVGREVARRLGFRYVDSGAMYRAVALAALRRGIGSGDEEALARLVEDLDFEFKGSQGQFRVFVDGEDITAVLRSEEVDAAVAQVARFGAVRKRIIGIQRELAREGGTVMEGRDIGTVVFPDAGVKIYLDASAEERVRRRSAANGSARTDSAAAAIRRRDEHDRTRHRSPLRPAADAVRIDSTRMSIGDVVDRILHEVALAEEKAQTRHEGRK